MARSEVTSDIHSCTTAHEQTQMHYVVTLAMCKLCACKLAMCICIWGTIDYLLFAVSRYLFF